MRHLFSVTTYVKDTTYLPVSDNTLPEDILAQFRTATRGAYSLRFCFSGEGYREQGHFFAAPSGVLRQMTTTLRGNEIRQMTPTRFLNASLSRSLEGVADGIGRLELSSRKQMVIDVLRRLDPAIEDIVTISRQGITQLHVRAHSKWIPIQFAGDGVLRLLQICLALLDMLPKMLHSCRIGCLRGRPRGRLGGFGGTGCGRKTSRLSWSRE